MWVNGDDSFTASTDAALPDNAFPFARLASVTLADQSTTFLYHQINGTTFAEEQWDASPGAWIAAIYLPRLQHPNAVSDDANQLPTAGLFDNVEPNMMLQDDDELEAGCSRASEKDDESSLGDYVESQPSSDIQANAGTAT
ncbi:hypothetical protein HO133_003248 [Letharia lupina]|uniref:Uncharacterized protein n=1 Tax=Letharia lupina TaxID=560253 RepID=A0A8H6F9C8_9LECA|nr:uncharacterized protein HO133_003248 [Letharia lupina]KAF6220117.1 hypothetical protein HO133_003248 [Letharia lupina]